MSFKRLTALSGHSGSVYAINTGKNAHTIFSASGDKYAVEWDLEVQKQLPLAVKFEQPIFSIIYIAEANLLIAGDGVGGIHVIDLAEKKEIRHLKVHLRGIFDFHYQKMYKQLIALGGDGLMSVWSVPDFELVRNIPLSTEKLRQITYSEKENMLAVACGDGYIRLLEPQFFNELQTIDAHKEGANSVAWHPTKPVLVSGGKDAMIRCWSTTDNYKEIMELPAHNYAIYSLVFDEKAVYMASASRDKTIKIWDANSLEPIQKLEIKEGGHTHSVNKLMWYGDTLVSCGDDRKIILWKQ